MDRAQNINFSMITDLSHRVQGPERSLQKQKVGRAKTISLLQGSGDPTHYFTYMSGLLAKELHVVAIDLPRMGFAQSGAHHRFSLQGKSVMGALLGEPQMSSSSTRLLDPVSSARQASCGAAGTIVFDVGHLKSIFSDRATQYPSQPQCRSTGAGVVSTNSSQSQFAPDLFYPHMVQS